MESPEYDVNVRDNAGYTPLHEACNKGHLGAAQVGSFCATFSNGVYYLRTIAIYIYIYIYLYKINSRTQAFIKNMISQTKHVFL